MIKRFFRLCIITSLLFVLSVGLFKTNAEASYVTIEGAQIRLAQDEYQGLRFVMSFDTNAPYTPLKYGVVVYPGSYNGDLNIDTEGAKYNYTTELSTISGIDNAYAFTIYGYKPSQYTKDITVRAFVQYVENGVTKYDYSNDVITRNIYEVASQYYSEVKDNEFVNNLIYAYSSFDTLKQEFLDDYNSFAETNYTFSNLNTASYKNFAKFVEDDYYGDKWYFLYKTIIDARITYKDEIESYAVANVGGYNANSNEASYTPFLQQILARTNEPDSGLRLWLKEISALFNQKFENYYSACSLNYANVTIYNVVTTNAIAQYSCEKEINLILNDNLPLKQLMKEEDKLIVVDDGDYFGGLDSFNYERNTIYVKESLADALVGVEDNTSIYVMDGVIDSSNVTISNDGINIYGPNKDVKIDEKRFSEATLNGTITVSSTVSDFTINGLKFGQNSKVVLSAPASASSYIDGFDFISNNCEIKLNASSFIKLGAISDNNYTYNLRFENNIFNEVESSNAGSSNAIIYLDNTANTYFINNKFTNVSYDAIHFNDTTKGLSGTNNEFIGNIFKDVTNTALHINWLSPYPSNGINTLDINNNVFENVSRGIYIGKYNNTDIYEHLYINANEFLGTLDNGIVISRCVSKARYQIYGNTFKTVPTEYYVNATQAASTSNPVTALVLFNYFYDNGAIIEPNADKFVNCSFVGDLEFLQVFDEVIKLEEVEFITNSYNTGITWTSSDDTIATVNEQGIVKGIKEGKVTITATHLSGDKITKEIEVVDNKLIQLLKDYSIGEIWNGNIDYVGTQATVTKNINGAASYYYFDEISIDDTSYYTTDTTKTYSTNNVKFITVHDTAGNASGSNAKANAAWCLNASNDSSSWHYTVGNDGIYQHYSESLGTWHAGDGGRAYALDDTGVKCLDGGLVPPTITFDSNGNYAINGISTSLKPYTNIAGTTQTTTVHKTSQINDTGIYWTVGANGNYYLNKTYYNSTYLKVCNYGGGKNSIGIETACNSSSDIYLTWQMTAKLVAQLLVKYDLTPKEVMQHHSFSGKNCPACMRGADMWPEFIKMVTVEYEVLKNYSDYTITFVSDNPTYLDNHGRVVANPSVDTLVTYTITVSKDGNETSVKLSTIIPAK